MGEKEQEKRNVRRNGRKVMGGKKWEKRNGREEKGGKKWEERNERKMQKETE